MKVSVTLVVEKQTMNFESSASLEAPNQISDFINQQFHAALNTASSLGKRIDSINVAVEY